MEKSPDAFRTISEAAEELGLPQHVLRFWETRFSTIRPMKRGGGRRYYRPEDVLLLKGIRHLLYDRGFTIKGVQRILKDQGARYVIAIADGAPIEELVQPASEPAAPASPAAAAVPEVEPDGAGIAPPQAAPSPVPAVPPQARNARLGRQDREKLEQVLKDLLECKRLLERAREN